MDAEDRSHFATDAQQNERPILGGITSAQDDAIVNFKFDLMPSYDPYFWMCGGFAGYGFIAFVVGSIFSAGILITFPFLEITFGEFFCFLNSAIFRYAFSSPAATFSSS